MNTTSVLNRASLSEQIKDALLERIVTGGLKPGERIIELKIADEMQTSQAPVREALRELEAIGVIESQRNRGARVRVIDNRELMDIYAVRAELEAFAGEIAAKKDTSIAKKLWQLFERMEKAAKAEDPLQFSRLNSDFHRTIVEASENSVLLEMWQSLHVRTRTMVNVARSAGDLVSIAASHAEIIEAIEAGDSDKARHASWKHVQDNAPHFPDD